MLECDNCYVTELHAYDFVIKRGHYFCQTVFRRSCKIENEHTKKTVVLIYTNEQSKWEIKKTVPFIIAPKRIKYLE